MGRFAEYVALINECGGSAIEFVLHPGAGSEELGRVHLLEKFWRSAIEIAAAGGLAINSHAPLPSEFGIATWNRDPGHFEQQFAPVLNFLVEVEATTSHPPVFVLHGAPDQPDATARYLRRLRGVLDTSGSSAQVALELRAPIGGMDNRFDREPAALTKFIAGLEVGRVGMCWDIAHDWQRASKITTLTDEMIAAINHVHIHDSRPDGNVHAPLDHGRIPWRSAIRQLQAAGWVGSITLEIRYRYATEVGEPWSVLRDNLLAVRSVLAGE
jgi:sugar phosphate isomerase/epimerase